MATIALVMTVRDERDMLRSNLLYHHYTGVDVCYIYDDGSTDGTMESIADLPFVVARTSADSRDTAVPQSLAGVSPEMHDHFAYRQLMNVVHASESARQAGAEWLVGVDADELVVADLTSSAEGALLRLLRSQPKSIDGVIFRPLEVLQRRLHYSNVMVEETLFKRWDSGSTRKTFDPFQNVSHEVPIIYGHRVGKMAIRTDRSLTPKDNHRFITPNGEKPSTVEQGSLLHFYSHDVGAFVRKFRVMKDHPDRHVQGNPVVVQKRLWRDVVNRSGFSDAELEDYYSRSVMFSAAEVDKLSHRGRMPWSGPPAVVEVTVVRDALAALADWRAPTVS